MPETERRGYNRREILAGVKDGLFTLVSFALGAQTTRVLNSREIAQGINEQSRETLLRLRDTSQYVSQLEEHLRGVELLLPNVIVRAYLPNKKAFCTLGFYDTSAYLISDDTVLLEQIINLVKLRVPENYLEETSRIDLVIQDVRLGKKPKKPGYLLDPLKPDALATERYN